MAKRATVRRRRRFLILSVVLFASITTLFVRDVLGAAHDSKSNQYTLNRSFAVLVNSSMAEQDAVDATTMSLLSQARSVSRSEFKTTLMNLSQRVDRIAENAGMLASPAIVRNANKRFIELTSNRVTAWRTIRNALASPLGLIDRPAPSIAEVRHALELIRVSNDQWATLRFALRHQPGHPVMRASTWSLATTTDKTFSSVVSLPQLTPYSAVAIGAIAIDPQPLPSRSAQIVLLPKTEIGIGVTIRNVGRSKVSAVISVSMRWRHADPSAVRMRRAIPAGTSVAVIVPAVPTYPGMRGTLTVHVSGAAPAFRGAATREYSVKVAPSD